MATALLYGTAPLHAWQGDIAIKDGNVKAAILTSSYTPDQDTDEFWSDISANEVTGTGYTAGGKALTTVTVTYTAGTNVVKVDSDDVSWTSSTITGRYLVLYYAKSGDTGGTASPLICYQDAGADVSSSDGTWSFTVDASGLFTDTVS